MISRSIQPFTSRVSQQSSWLFFLAAGLFIFNSCSGETPTKAAIPTETSTTTTTTNPTATKPGEYELWREGREYWYKRDWKNAAEVFKKFSESFPDSPQRCKSDNYLGYCYHKMGKRAEAFEVFSRLIDFFNCKPETVVDAKSTRLQLAFEMVKDDPSMKNVLTEGLRDPNVDIRLAAAVWLSELDDPSGMDVFFDIVRTEEDQDRRDTATKHILKLGNQKDQETLRTMIEEFKSKPGREAKLVRLIIRDPDDPTETIKVSLPISLLNVILKMLTDEQMELVKDEAGIDLKNLDFNLEDMPSGTVLFEITDKSGQHIKLFLE